MDMRIPLISYNIGRIDIRRFQSEKFVICVESPNENRKLMQVIFRKDGSIFVAWPYFKYKDGVLSKIVVPPTNRNTSISLVDDGKVTSHLVKYSHHADGRAHFSQDGKIHTWIRIQSVALSHAEGHLFTMMVQNLAMFQIDAPSSKSPCNLKRTQLNFKFNEKFPEAVKIIGHWYLMRSIPRLVQNKQLGPDVRTKAPDGIIRSGVLVGSPVEGYRFGNYCLLMTCVPIPSFANDSNAGLLFIGGFDKNFDDPNNEATALAASYPASNYHELRQKIGSIDFT
jgi:hypothetical protein